MHCKIRFICVCPIIRVPVDLAGLSVLLERLKVLTSLQLGILLALASNNLWIAITRFDISLLPTCLVDYASINFLVDLITCLKNFMSFFFSLVLLATELLGNSTSALVSKFGLGMGWEMVRIASRSINSKI